LPAEFGRYRVLKLLGKGGMGAVYLAEDIQLRRQVALKMLYVGASESPQRVERFVREAQSAAVLQHPNVCTLFDGGQIDGRPFLTMAYIAGNTLEDEIDPDIPVPQVRAAEIARKIALALDHAHSKGIVHRDLKPANVMMTPEGEPVVMDFGLAKRVGDGEPNEAKLTRDGGILGTPTYMSPEQVKGQVKEIGPVTDVYSLGVILFEMLTGNPPYSGPVGIVMGQILVAPVPSVREFRPEVDARLDTICSTAMAKDPISRYPNMVALAKTLGEYLKDPPASPSTLPDPVEVRDIPPQIPEPPHSHLNDLQEPAGQVQTDYQKSYEDDEKSKARLILAFIIASVLGGVIVVAAIIITLCSTKPDEEKATQKTNGDRFTNVSPNSPPVKPEATKGKAAGEKQFVQLFNGKDLTGWKNNYPGFPGTWEVQKGILVGHGIPGRGHLQSDRQFLNFYLLLETMLPEGPFLNNASLEFRAVDLNEAGFWHYVTLLGCADPKQASVLGNLRAGLTPLRNASNVPPVKPGEWFTQEIIVQGKHIQVSINGKTVVDYIDAEHEFTEGQIVITCREQCVVRFRKIEIMEFSSTKSSL
jgi:serine/threonine protein kinase